MLTNRDEYYWYGGNAIKRIAIEGKPYPERSAKLVMLGEDEAYIQEAARERVDEARDAFLGFFADYVLRIPWLGRRGGYPWSDWCWRLIRQLDGSSATSIRFLDSDKAEAFEVPSNPFLVWRTPHGSAFDESYVNDGEEKYKELEDLLEEQSHYTPGSPDWNRLQEQIDAKRDEIQQLTDEVSAIDAAESQRQGQITTDIRDAISDARSNCNDYADAYRKAVYGSTTTKGLAQKLVEDLQSYENERDAAIREADDAYRGAKAAIDQTRTDGLATAKVDYEAEVKAIEAQYEEDPPEGVDYAEWQRRKALALWNAEVEYSDEVDEINSKWQTDSDKAKRDRDAAVVDAWRTYIADAKERWLTHIEDVNALREDFETNVNDENEARNREVERLLGESTSSGDFDTYGIPYAYGLAAIDEARRDMLIDFSCLDHYLRKTPTSGYYILSFVAHMHSSDATERMYADLEMRRCVDATPIQDYLYRDAFTRTNSSGVVASYDEHLADSSTYTRIRYKYERKTTGGNDYVDEYTYSNTRFSIYFGRRHEVEDESVEAIYATVAVRRNEYALRERYGFGPIPYFSRYDENQTYGYLRVKLENMGVQNASYLAELDAIDDDLAAAIKEIDDEYAEALADIEDAYLKALDAADKEYDADVAAAAKEHDRKILDAHDDFMDLASTLAAVCNSDLQDINDDEEMGYAEKTAAKRERLDKFLRDASGLYDALEQAVDAAKREYEEAVADAEKKRDDSKSQARTDKTQAIADLDEEMRVEARKADLRDEAQEAKDAVYARAAAQGLTLRPNARSKWSFDARAIDSDTLQVPDFGDRGQYNDPITCVHSSIVSVLGIVHLDVVYAPKSETGMDYAPYMAEAKAGYARPRKYRQLKFFDYYWSDPVS